MFFFKKKSGNLKPKLKILKNNNAHSKTALWGTCIYLIFFLRLKVYAVIFAGLTHLESNSIVSSEIQHPWVTYSARRSTGSVYKTARVPLEQLSVRLCLSVHHIGAATWLSSTENGKSSAVKILAIIWQPLVCYFYFFTFCFYVKKIVTSYFFLNIVFNMSC